MSVINDMLKDLDSRREADTTSVPVGDGPPKPGRGRRWFGVGLLLVAVVVLVAAIGVGYRGWGFDSWRALLGMTSMLSAGEGRSDSTETTTRAEADDLSNDAAGASEEAPTETVAAVASPVADETGVASRRAKGDGAGSDGGGGEPQADIRLAGAHVDTGQARTTLELELTDEAGAVEHERDGASGELRLSDVQLADDFSAPSVTDSALRGLVVVPSDDAIAIQYRAAREASVTLEGGTGAERLALRIELPSDERASSSPVTSGSNTGPMASSQSADGSGVAQPDDPAPAAPPDGGAGDGGGGESAAESEAVETPRAKPDAPPEPSGEATASNSQPAAASGGESDGGQITRERKGPTPGEEAEAFYRKALEAIEAGDRATARAELNNALARDGAHTGARQALAMIHLREGRPARAGEVLTDGFDRGARTSTLVSLYARSWLERGEAARAVAIMEEGRETVSVDADYLAMLAALYQQQGRYADAASAYQGALKRQADVAEWWAGFGIALDNSGDGQRARQAYKRALDQGGLSDSLTSYVRRRVDALE